MNVHYNDVFILIHAIIKHMFTFKNRKFVQKCSLRICFTNNLWTRYHIAEVPNLCRLMMVLFIFHQSVICNFRTF